MLLKELNNCASLAWGVNKQGSSIFATGRPSNQNQNNIFLCLYSIEIQQSIKEPSLIAKAQTEQQFSALAWTKFGEDDQYPLGLIIGGHSDGSITIWDPQSIIEYSRSIQNDNQIDLNVGCLCYEQNLYDTPVASIEVNPFKPHLIGCGGGSEVLILNIEKDVTQPQIFSPGTPNLHEGYLISSVSWNKRVQHILASSSTNGLTVVWDLKKNEAIFNFQDNSIESLVNVSLTWNPEIPTQIAVGFDEEKTNDLQIWDLRNPQGPVVRLSHQHKGGISAIDWNFQENALILTVGRDNKILCWNYKTGEILMQIFADAPVQQIKWNQINRELFAINGEDESIKIFQARLDDYAFDWRKRKLGAVWGPSGKLALFSHTRVSEWKSKGLEDSVGMAIRDFDGFLQEMDKLNELIHKSKVLFSSQDREQWEFLQAVCETPAQLLNKLGFNSDEIVKKTENYTGKTHRKTNNQQEKQITQSKNQTYEFTDLTQENAEIFFDNLKIPQKEATPQKLQKKKPSFNCQDQENNILEQVSKNINWNFGAEKLIKENILIGNINGAIDCALKCGRIAEGLLLAYANSDSLFQQTANSFFLTSQDSFIKGFFKNYFQKTKNELVKNADLKSWQELASIAIAEENREWISQSESDQMMNDLAERFLKEKKDEHHAALCFIIARNVDRLCELFEIQMENMDSSNRKVFAIQSLAKLVALTQKAQNVRLKEKQLFDRLVLEVAQIAIERQNTILAYNLLKLGDQSNSKIKEQQYFLYLCNLEEFDSLNHKPPSIPYKIENVCIQRNKNNQQKQMNWQPQVKSQCQPQKQSIKPPIQQQFAPPVKHINQQQTFPHTPFSQPPNIEKDKFQPNKLQSQEIIPRPPIKMFEKNKNEELYQNQQSQIHQSTENQQHLTQSTQYNRPKQQIFQPLQQKEAIIPSRKQSQSSQKQLIAPPPKNTQQKLFGHNQYQAQNNQFEQQNQNPFKQQLNQIQSPKIGLDQQQQQQIKRVMTIPPPQNRAIIKNPLNQTIGQKYQQQTENIQQTQIQQQQNTQSSIHQAFSNETQTLQQNEQAADEQCPKQQYYYDSRFQQQQQQPKQQETKQIDSNKLTEKQNSLIYFWKFSMQIFQTIESNQKRRNDLEKSLNLLFEYIAQDNLKPNTLELFEKMTQDFQSDKLSEALQTYNMIVKTDWDQNKDWLKTIKRILMKK